MSPTVTILIAFASVALILGGGLLVVRRLEWIMKREVTSPLQRLTASLNEVKQTNTVRAAALTKGIEKGLGKTAARLARLEDLAAGMEKDRGKTAVRIRALTAGVKVARGTTREVAAGIEGVAKGIEKGLGKTAARLARLEDLAAGMEKDRGKTAVRIRALTAGVKEARGTTTTMSKELRDKITVGVKELGAGIAKSEAEIAAQIKRLNTASKVARRKEAERARSDHEHFATMLKLSRIRALQLEQIFPGIGRQAVEIGAIDPDTGHRNHVDMLYVCAMARHLRARRIFEFGTYLGRTTYHLALGRLEREVFALDLDPESETLAELELHSVVQTVLERGLQGLFFRGKRSEKRITQLQGDSRTFDFSPYEASMDFIFIDGGHSLELVENDTAHAFEMLKPGGVVVWHDYAPKSRDVVSFAHQLSQTKPLFWVVDSALLVYIDGVDAMTYEASSPIYALQSLKSS